MSYLSHFKQWILSWLRNYSCQYEFRRFNQVLSMLEESWYIPACGQCCLNSVKLNLLSLRATLVQFLCWPAFREFFFCHFQIVNSLELFFESLLELPCFPAFYLFIFLFLQLLQVPEQAGKHIFLFTQQVVLLYSSFVIG